MRVRHHAIGLMGNIVWLASYPKSGNTWLRAFLANLIANRAEPVPLDELRNYCDDESLPERYAVLAGKPASELDYAAVSALRHRVHGQIAAANPRTVFVKTHNPASYPEGDPIHNPHVTAAAIYVVRNPLDVVVSMTHHFGLGVDEAIDFLGHEQAGTPNERLFIGQWLGSWSTHVAGWTSQTFHQSLLLRYEDLLEKPAKAFGKVVRLVAPTADPARVERARKHADFRILARMETRDGFIERSDKAKSFFRSGRTGEWRLALNRHQVLRVIERHRVEMARLRYIPSGY
jgi:hypothetical protein